MNRRELSGIFSAQSGSPEDLVAGTAEDTLLGGNGARNGQVSLAA